MTRTRSDDRRALDLLAAFITFDTAALDKIITEAADAGHLGHLVFGILEVIEQVLEQLPRPQVAAAVEQIAAIATGHLVVEESSATSPELVVLAAKLTAAHAINDGDLMAELMDQPVSAPLLLDAIVGLHLQLLPALGSPAVLRALKSAALKAALEEVDDGE